MNPLLQRMGLLLLPDIRSRTRSVSGDLMTDLVDKYTIRTAYSQEPIGWPIWKTCELQRYKRVGHSSRVRHSSSSNLLVSSPSTLLHHPGFLLLKKQKISPQPVLDSAHQSTPNGTSILSRHHPRCGPPPGCAPPGAD